jgi:glycosyltransferase involved in cell wall biosynthesis
MNKPRNIVLLTTWFPPVNGVAVNRMEALEMYWDKQETAFHIITLQADKHHLAHEHTSSGAQIIRLPNKPLIDIWPTIPGDAKWLHYTKVAWNIMVNKLMPHRQMDWASRALHALQAFHLKNPVDVIISSAFPIEPHWVAKEFCKMHPKVLWVADSRDELSKNPHIDEKTRTQYKEVERWINEYAQIATSVSAPIVADFKTLLPKVAVVEEIRNGHNIDLPTADAYTFNEVFTIVYAGTFYGARKPTTFFQGMLKFLEANPQAKVLMRFVGTSHNFNYPQHDRLDIEFLAKCSNAEACRQQERADANLLLLPILEARGVYSGKLFDYLAALKPIIAVVDPTDVASLLIEECEGGYVAHFDKIAEIESAIQKAYSHWSNKAAFVSNRTKVEQLHRKYQIAKLQALVEKQFQSKHRTL